MKITVAHSPDADDAFMFYPLFGGKVDTQGLELAEVREDIESLNCKAEEGAYEVTAISFHAYPSIQPKYLILPTGACFGEKTGPVLVANRPLKPRQILRLRAAIPGKRTTAFLLLRLWEKTLAGEGRSGLSYTEVPFDQIIDRVAEKKMDLGLLIHEGQLTYQDKGLHKVIDLGEWWQKETALPLPLGAIAIRRDLDWEIQKKIATVIRESIVYALEHKEEALAAALPFARGMDAEKTAQFVGTYVNDLTVDWGRRGLKAIKTLFDKGFSAGMLSRRVFLDQALFDFNKSTVWEEEIPLAQPPEELPPEEVPSESPPPVSEEGKV